MFDFKNTPHSRSFMARNNVSNALIQYNSLSPLLTFTRASTHSYFDKDNILQTVPTNNAAFDKRGLSLFQSRTNFHPRSENISTWTDHINTSVVLTSVNAPDGTTNSVYRFNRQNTTASYRRHPAFQKGNASLEILTASIFIKKDDAQYFAMRIQNNGYTNHCNAIYDLSNTSVSYTSRIGLITNVTAEIIDCENDWYRCSMTFTAGAGNADIDFFISFNQSNKLIDGVDTSSGCGGYVWGAQVENGSIATPYIPTNGLPQTRAQPSCISSGDNFLSFYNQQEGTFIIDFTPMTIKPVSQLLMNVTGISGNRIFLELYNSGTLNLGYEVNGVFNFHGLGNIIAGKSYRLVFAYKEGDLATAFSNGILIERTHSISNLNALGFGISTSGTLPADMYIKQFTYYPRRLSNTQMTQFFDFTTGGDSFMDGAGGIGIRQSLGHLGYKYWDTAVGGSTLAQAVSRLEALVPRNKVIFCDGSVNGHGTILQDMAQYQKIYNLTGGNVVIIAPSVFPNMVGSTDESYTIALTTALLNAYGSDKVINMTAIAENLAGTTDRSSIAYRNQFQQDGVHPAQSLSDSTAIVVQEKL